MNKFKKRILSILLMGFIFGITVKANPVQASTSKRVVRYGYLVDSKEDIKNTKSSNYFYDYMQEVADYAGWKYKYVYGTWDQLYSKLLKNEIDVLPGTVKNNQRVKEIKFSALPMISDAYYVFVPKDEAKKYKSNNELNGKKIALSNWASNLSAWKSWQKYNKVNTKSVYIRSHKERIAALRSGKVDAIIDSVYNIRKKENIVPLTTIGVFSDYVAVNKKQSAIWHELNLAQEDINATNPGFSQRLMDKYNSDLLINNILTTKQQYNFSKMSRLTIGYLSDSAPYVYKDKNGKVNGVLIDVLDYIGKKYHFKRNAIFKEYDSYSSLVADLKKGKLAMAFPLPDNYQDAEKVGALKSNSLATASLQLIVRPEFKKRKNLRIAIAENELNSLYSVKQYAPEAKIKIYSNRKACYDAVLCKRADATVITSAQSAIYYNRLKSISEHLDVKDLPYSVNYCIWINPNDVEILRIINQGIFSYGTNRLNDSAVRHTDIVTPVSLEQLIYQHRFLVNVVALTAILLLAVGTIYYVLSRRKSALTKWMLEHDSMTQLYNRRSFQEYIKKNGDKVPSKNTVVAYFDANNLKKTNDLLGHKFGDDLLVGIASCLVKGFGNLPKSRIYRIGGDEFVAIFNADHEELSNSIDRLNAALENYSMGEIKGLSLSSGYVESNEHPDKNLHWLLRTADKLMYRQKKLNHQNNAVQFIADKSNKTPDSVNENYHVPIDSVTGLTTISYLISSSDALTSQLSTMHVKPAVVILHVNKLKEFNRLFGYETGNRVLSYFANLLAEKFGKSNCSHVAGAKFSVLSSSVNIDKRLNEVCEDLTDTFKDVSIRSGIYVVKPEENFLQALDKANRACESITDQSRSRYRFSDE